MNLQSFDLPGPILVTPPRYKDVRGWFCETWNREKWAACGLPLGFLQDNMSFSENRGTIRGLHFQRPPFAQAKLVSVVRGAILDVAVDLRSGSATFGKYISARLDAEDGTQLYVPAGFAHGFCTLCKDVLVAYKVDAPYSKAHEGGIRWNDPDLCIAWGDFDFSPVLSEKDLELPFLRDFDPRTFEIEI